MQHSERGEAPLILTTEAAVAIGAPTDDAALVDARKQRGVWARLRRQRVAILCFVVITLFVLAAIFAPLLAPHDPDFGYTTGLTADGHPLGAPVSAPGRAGSGDGLSARVPALVGLLAKGNRYGYHR